MVERRQLIDLWSTAPLLRPRAVRLERAQGCWPEATPPAFSFAPLALV